MWTYLIRRLLVMIPTLFGVTLISFCVMQLAPGDPLQNQLGASGTVGSSSQTREAYLIQKRDLKLDKPLLLNFNYFRDYSAPIRAAAFFVARTPAEIEAELPNLVSPTTDEQRERLKLVRSLKIEQLDRRLPDPAQSERLAKAIQGLVQQIYCEDTGVYGAPAAFALLAPEEDLKTRIGAIRCLNRMVVEPHVYTYSQQPGEEETGRIVETWRTWFESNQVKLPAIDDNRRKTLEQEFAGWVAETERTKLFKRMRNHAPDLRFFAEKLLSTESLPERVIASLALRINVGDQLLKMDVPLDATEEQVRDVSANWLAHYEPRKGDYQPSFVARVWYIFSDTQYAHMLWRLVTFNFGRSALKTREPVGEKIWDAVLVSAPLMLLSQLFIYLVSVPLGVVCAVNRGNPVDRLTSLTLFFLYSVPGFVAGMLFLLLLCYGDYLKIFPMQGMHSDGAEEFGFWRYALDYVWHITLPVVCLSLFSLASLAMYSRSSMIEALGQDYVRTARAKGLSSQKVVLKHALRNGLIPIITLFSNLLPAMLGGSVLIEVLFGIPGMGRVSYISIDQKDFPTLMALIYIDAMVVMASILLTDILYVIVDPRISFAGGGKAG